MSYQAAFPSSPSSARSPQLQEHGMIASTTLRRRVMHCAAMGEWAEVRAAVDEQGCNVNIQDEETHFSLAHWAANQGNEEALRWLAEKGAYLRLKDSRGNPPLLGARANTAAFLLAQIYSPVERIAYARGSAAEDATAALDLMMAELGHLGQEALNEPLWDESGAPLIVWLVGRHHGAGEDGFDVIPMLRWLASRGANLEAVDEERNGLLHTLDYSLGASTVLPLLQWALLEAQVQHRTARNAAGDTPAHLCAYSSPTGNDAHCCLQMFESVGTNLAFGDAKGTNVPMLLARYHGDGPWLSWCQYQAGVDPGALCANGRTVADYLALYGTAESEEEDEG